MPESNAISPAPADSAPTRWLVWDLPTRLFHWTLAVLFLAAFALALLSPEHSQAYLVHMVLGLILPFAIGLRLIWGLVGSRPSRFTSFLYSPAALVRYVRQAVSGTDKPVTGHNPGSSYATYAMLLLPLALVATGLLRKAGGEWAEELHAALAYGMVAVVAAHLLGLFWHARRHGEAIALAMVDGRRPVAETEAIPSAHNWAGAVFLLLVGGWSLALGRGFDATRQQVTLPMTGTVLPLGEAKEGKGGGEDAQKHQGKEHDDD